MGRRRWLAGIGGIAAAALLAAQFVGPSRSNPAADATLALEAGGTVPAPVHDVLRRACYDCHSNETRWPLYSRVAPVSWLVITDVNRGRGQLNFSRWRDYNAYDRADLLDEACRRTRAGEMPLRPYVWMHPEARLTEAEVSALCAWTAEEAVRLTSAPSQ